MIAILSSNGFWVTWVAAVVLIALASFIMGQGGWLLLRAAVAGPSKPFTAPQPSPLLIRETAVSLWDGVVVGYLRSGKPLVFRGRDTSMLIAGETASGKTVFLNSVISGMALDPRVQFSLFDGKGSLQFTRWDGVAEHIDISGDPARLLSYLTSVYRELERRKQVLIGLDKVELDYESYLNDLPLFFLVIDELANYTQRNKKLAQRINEVLGMIAAQGRSFGILLVLATQHPSTEVIPSLIRNNIAMRVCFRVGTPQASNMVLGAGLAKVGCDASTIRMIADRGIGYARLEGYRPKKFRSCLLQYRDTKPIANRARAIRSGITFPTLPLAAPQDLSAESPDALPVRDFVADLRVVYGNSKRLHNSISLQRLQGLDPEYYGHWTPKKYGHKIRDVGLAKYIEKWTEGDRRNHTGLPAYALDEALEPADGLTPQERRKQRETAAMDALDEVGKIAYEARLAEIERATNCEYCGKPLTLDDPPTVDHWQPLAKGGTNDASNLRAACGSCNSSKRDNDPVTWLRERLRRVA